MGGRGDRDRVWRTVVSIQDLGGGAGHSGWPSTLFHKKLGGLTLDLLGLGGVLVGRSRDKGRASKHAEVGLRMCCSLLPDLLQRRLSKLEALH